jgi:hypothetical protein
VLSLRGAGLPSRSYAWLSLLVLLAAAAAADALHATGTRLPRRPTAATAAVIPWVLVLIGFGLLLCMLRQARLRRAAAAAPAAVQPVVVPEPSGHVAVRHGADSRSGPGTSSRESTARPVLGQAGTAAALPPDLAIDAGPAQGDPARDEEGLAVQLEMAQVPQARQEYLTAAEPAPAAEPASAAEPAPAAEPTPAAEAVPSPPHFDRMRSSPVPPGQ